MSWTLKSQFIESARLKLKDQHSCWSWHTMKTNRQFFHLLDGGDPGRGGMGLHFCNSTATSTITSTSTTSSTSTSPGGWKRAEAACQERLVPSLHSHASPFPICPTLSLTKRHCHICSICFYATSTSCIRYNLSVGLKKRNEPEMSNLNFLALQDCMNW